MQLGRQAVYPPGQAKQDLWIIQQIARGMGLDWNYDGPKDVFEEMTRCMPTIAGITWERLEQEHSVTYPCNTEDDPGQDHPQYCTDMSLNVLAQVFPKLYLQ